VQKAFLLIFCIMFLVSASVSAQTLTGTVNNGTTGRPAAGDEVLLIKPAQGMEEAARTKTIQEDRRCQRHGGRDALSGTGQ
jgi:5-hydroxyisourate hydrolase-like protein (transthyretin family)